MNQREAQTSTTYCDMMGCSVCCAVAAWKLMTTTHHSMTCKALAVEKNGLEKSVTFLCDNWEERLVILNSETH